MKLRLLLIVFLLATASGVWAQAKSLQTVDRTVGIGRLQISLNDSIPFYKSVEDIRAIDTLCFTKITDGIDKGRFTMSTLSKFDIVPFIFYPGNSYNEAAANVEAGRAYYHPVLVLRVINLIKGGFEVVLNENTFETCIIKKDKNHTLYTNGAPYWSLNHSREAADPAWFLYESWANYLKRLTAIQITNPQLYDNPNGSLLISPDGKLSFQVVYTIGEWVKVRLTGEQPDGVRDEAWLRWTDGKNILVTPLEEVYY
ncbi:MAG: hypothetical protein LBG19_01270 [Prevotellaceae bacterium]|jgi:hypothetical protein|nr:hypothetical protein [Prevotellaceae bacterium]